MLGCRLQGWASGNRRSLRLAARACSSVCAPYTAPRSTATTAYAANDRNGSVKDVKRPWYGRYGRLCPLITPFVTVPLVGLVWACAPLPLRRRRRLAAAAAYAAVSSAAVPTRTRYGSSGSSAPYGRSTWLWAPVQQGKTGGGWARADFCARREGPRRSRNPRVARLARGKRVRLHGRGWPATFSPRGKHPTSQHVRTGQRAATGGGRSAVPARRAAAPRWRRRRPRQPATSAAAAPAGRLGRRARAAAAPAEEQGCPSATGRKCNGQVTKVPPFWQRSWHPTRRAPEL